MTEFNDHFVYSDNSLVNTVKHMYDEFLNTYKALLKVAEQYGKTEELNQRLMQR